jgi:hypothetical protein
MLRLTCLLIVTTALLAVGRPARADLPETAALLYGQRFADAQATAGLEDDQALIGQMERAAARTDDPQLREELTLAICSWALDEPDLLIEPGIAPRMWLESDQPEIGMVEAFLNRPWPELAPEHTADRAEFLLAAAMRLADDGQWEEASRVLSTGAALLTGPAMSADLFERYAAAQQEVGTIRTLMETARHERSLRTVLHLALALAANYPTQIADWIDGLPAGDRAVLLLMACEPDDRTADENIEVAEWLLILTDPEHRIFDDKARPEMLALARMYVADGLAMCGADQQGRVTELTQLDRLLVDRLQAEDVVAIPPTVAPRCRRLHDQRRVNATEDWHPVAEIRTGDTVSIAAEGRWHTYWGGGPEHMCGPEGHGQGEARYGHLIGRIGGGEPFDILDGTVFIAEADGTLELVCSDDRRSDNAGYLTVTIDITPADN